MVRVGVTGATGFIGGALVPALAALGYDLCLLDDRSGPTEVEHPRWPVARLAFESDAGLALLSDADVVLHLAAVSGVMACASDPVGSARSNVDGTARLVAACRERVIPIAFASSFAVVGAPDQLPVRESTPARPTHEYARQKAAGEAILARAAEGGRYAAATLRQSNVYGGYRVGDRYVSKANVIQRFAEQSVGRRLSVNAPGTQRRDYIHLRDIVAHWEAMVRWLRRPEAARSVSTWNAASGEALSVLEVADRVAAVDRTLWPDAPPLAIEVVPNPRGGVELIEPEFAVSRAETERRLGVSCRENVTDSLPEVLREARRGVALGSGR